MPTVLRVAPQDTSSAAAARARGCGSSHDHAAVKKKKRFHIAGVLFKAQESALTCAATRMQKMATAAARASPAKRAASSFVMDCCRPNLRGTAERQTNDAIWRQGVLMLLLHLGADSFFFSKNDNVCYKIKKLKRFIWNP